MAVEIIGQSKVMLEALDSACHLAKSDYSLLIQGETGTGKELFARLVHEQSPRAHDVFLPVNIAAFNSNLIDSELFGHEKGAFTGATSMRKGAFERAGGGTVLLDEIGDLSLDLQVKLLRVLESKEFLRVGGDVAIPLKSRVLAATNVDLEQSIAKGRFREDLFYRFGPYVRVPPLRERQDDIFLLAEHIIKNEEKYIGQPYPDWFDKAYQFKLAQMVQEFPCQWSGNVRGLQIVLRAVLVEVSYYMTPEKFENQVRIILERECCSRERSSESKLFRLISDLVRDSIRCYPSSRTSLRSRLNGLLIEAISEGLDLALNVDEFRPRSGKEMGDILGIPSLVLSNRPSLPNNEYDYIVKALKNLGCRDELPKKVNELIAM